MQGTNQLVLNRATLCEALNVWLEKKFAGEAPKATAVMVGEAYPNDFIVVLQAPAEEVLESKKK